MDTGLRRTGFASAALSVSALVWTLQLGALTPADFSGTAVVLMAVSVWIATVAAVAGMLVARARWARRLGLGVAAAEGVLALLSPLSVWWGVGLVATAVAAVSMAGPWLDGIVRGRPSASGPPARVVLMAVVLVWVPFGLGVTGAGGWAAVTVAITALVAAYWFLRALPGAVAAVRIVWPLTALALAWRLGFPAGAVAAALAVVVALLSWHPQVYTSVHPLVEPGSRVPIPPELTPREILDAADLDDRGRPR